MKEEWKVVNGYPMYEVSNLGRVRNRKTYRILNQSIQSSGNAIVCLSNGGKIKTFSICRLILETFSPCDDMENLIIKYKDGNKSNNILNNLEWSDQKMIYNTTPNELKELKNSIMLHISKAIDEWYEKYNRKK